MTEPVNRRILVIDDNRAIHDDFNKILAPGGAKHHALSAFEDSLFGGGEALPEIEPFEVASAFQGQDALELVRRARDDGRPFALAFVDVRMPPGWDGVQTTAEIWKTDPDIQIVLCTAYSDYSWNSMIARLGQSDRLVVLKKPFDNIEVLQLASTLTTKWALARTAKRRLDELDRIVAERTRQLCAANEELLADISGRKQTELRLSAFAALGRRLSAAQNPKVAAQVIVQAADQLIGWDACLCALYSADEDRLHYLLSMDLIDGQRAECHIEPPIQKPGPLAQKAFHDGPQLILRDDPATFPPDSTPFGDQKRPSASILYVPIRNGAGLVGILSIQSYKPRAYDPHHLQTLQALAEHCGSALHRIKSEEALRLTELQYRQSQKMEAIGQLAGGVAHDFNNLLLVILGNAEFAMREISQAAPDAAECLKEVLDAANRAANLTRQLLAFSRKQLVQAEPLNLNNHVAQLSKMLQRIIGEDIQLHCDCQNDLPLVHADPGMLDQVIMNLVVNSRDAMPDGGSLHLATRSLTLNAAALRSRPDARPGTYVCLSVADTGAGIAPENLSRIFEPFFTTKQRGKGTGLGLATVFGIVKQHQGWVEVASTVGQGATFQIFLPALRSHDTETAAAKPRPGACGGHESVLLVEDDEAVRRLSLRYLKEAGYQPLEASSGQEALRIWDAHQNEIDLLLTDIVMPGGINGRVLAERLTAAKPELKVLFMSGYGGDVLGEDPQILQRPNSRFLKKPCCRDEFLRAMRDHLDDTPPRRQ
ncbi:MAG TPA: response regulator [Candidatus Acidoferrum sp.]|nr:response regulator [Candidatus Acidoferrum sp.]